MTTKGLAKQEEQDPLGNFDEAELQELYGWIDSIPLSRPKRNIARDFSDGVLMSEIIHFYFPKMVELHNYTSSMATATKQQNWLYLNRKVFNQLNFELGEDVIRDVCTCKPGCVEKILMEIRTKLKKAEYEINRQKKRRELDKQVQQRDGGRKENDQPEADQYIYMGSPGRGMKGHKNQEVEKITSKNLNKRHADHIITNKKLGKKPSYELINESVSRLSYEEKEQECFAKDETIKILQAKIQRLEHLIHLKDVRIDDLQARLEAMRPTGHGHGGKR